MFKLSLKHVWSRKGRLILTALAVIAGTAFLSGVFVFTDTIKASFDRIFATAYEETDAYVRSGNVIEGEFGNETRDYIDVGLLDVVAAVPGVEEAVPDIFTFAAMTFDGEEVGEGNSPRVGSNWVDSDRTPWLIDDGRPPTNGSEVVVDRATAKAAGMNLGDTVSVTTLQGTRQFEIVGIVTFAGADGAGGATFALFDLQTSLEFVVGDTTKLNGILVGGDGSLSQEELATAIEQALVASGADESVETLTGKEIVAENQNSLREGLSFLTIFLSIFAVISLFVGSFIIYNVFSISAAQRTQENALMRAIGASRAQVTRSMFIEAMIVGIGGSLLGCVGGIGLASGILAFLNAAGFGPGDTVLELNPTGFLITLIVGTAVTLVCAIAPALRSGRVPPLAALRDVAIDNAGVSRRRKVIGTITVLLAIAAVAEGVADRAIFLGLGVALLFVSLVVLGPLVAAPVAKVASPVLGKLVGASGTMAGRNAARSPKRTAITAGALAIGLSLMIGIATLGSSAKASIREVLDESFVGDYIIKPNQQMGVLSPDLVAEVEGAGIGDVFVIGIAPARVGVEDELKDTTVITIDPEGATRLFTFEFTAGGFEQLTTTGVLLNEGKASSLGVELGDKVGIALLDGTTVDAEVQGIYTTDGYTDVLIHEQMVRDPSAAQAFDLQMYVKVDGGESGSASRALEAIVEKYPAAEVLSHDGYIDEFASQIDGFLNFIYALLLMSIFIAAMGIVITLRLAVWERRRELGLLRAVGTTRRQVRSAVLWESLITGVVGALMGVVLGSALGWIIVKTFEDDGLGVYSPPLQTIAMVTVMSVVLAALAAFIPARKAAKSDILAAIATT